MTFSKSLEQFKKSYLINYEIVDKLLTIIVDDFLKGLDSSLSYTRENKKLSQLNNDSQTDPLDNNLAFSTQPRNQVSCTFSSIPKSQFKEPTHIVKQARVNDSQSLDDFSYSRVKDDVDDFLKPNLLAHESEDSPKENHETFTKDNTSNRLNNNNSNSKIHCYLSPGAKEKPDMVLIPEGSRVIQIITRNGIVIEKVYLSPYGNTIKLFGNYKLKESNSVLI